MSDDRDERGRDVTDRLAQRFESPASDETAQTSKRDKSDTTGKTDMTDTTAQTREKSQTDESEQRTETIKDRPSVLMYLPEDLHKELDLRFDELNLKHKREFGEAIEKNRDFYPAVIEAALEGTDIEDVLEIE
jgi:hypothetical protein